MQLASPDEIVTQEFIEAAQRQGVIAALLHSLEDLGLSQFETELASEIEQVFTGAVPSTVEDEDEARATLINHLNNEMDKLEVFKALLQAISAS